MERDNLLKTPIVFISYAWTDDAFTSRVVEFAERLVHCGIDVRFDKWDLKPGQDKYKFMEQAVNNTDIDKVLLLLNDVYKEKADLREGGVGDETLIITPEVYTKAEQTKFIPVLFENDEKGNPCVPCYLGTRIFIDLTMENPDYEQRFDYLVREIFGQPQYIKPKLGTKPVWLESDQQNFSEIRNFLSQYSKTNLTRTQRISLVNRIINSITEKAAEYIPSEEVNGALVYRVIGELKPLRDVYLEFIEQSIIQDSSNLQQFIPDQIELLHNKLVSIVDNAGVDFYEVFNYFIWEIFICTVALLWSYEQYSVINSVLNNNYLIQLPHLGESNMQEETCLIFREWFAYLEDAYKPKCDSPRLITLAGDMLVNQREKLPILTSKAIVNADILICQLTTIHELRNSNNWFPITYIYSKETMQKWGKLKSASFCQRLFPLFGVNSVDELKKAIVDHPVSPHCTYQSSHRSCPSITDGIEPNLIGSKP